MGECMHTKCVLEVKSQNLQMDRIRNRVVAAGNDKRKVKSDSKLRMRVPK
jgi:hypothetical protein